MQECPCTSCKEHCCIGDYGTFVTLHDIKRISEHIKKNPDEFARYANICSSEKEQKELMEEKDHSYFEYCDTGKVPQLNAKKDGSCIFLKDNRCEVYPVRPLICKIFPVGFKKEKDKIRLFIEEEDKYCPITEKNSLSHILDFLGYTEEKAIELSEQFLKEIEYFKKHIENLEKSQLNEIIKEIKE